MSGAARAMRRRRAMRRDRRRDLVYDDAGVRAKWGVEPAAIPDWLALVGDAADGFPGIPGFGAVAASTLLAAFDSLEGVRAAPHAAWPARVRGAERLAATLIH
jgi:5'-3' exonuclease